MEGHPTDVIVDDLARTYQAGARRLAAIVQAGLRRGLDPTRAGGLTAQRGDATLAYRERQLRAAVATLEELRQAGRAHAPAVAARAYGAGLLAVDRTALGDLSELRPRFGGIHATAVDALAANMTGSLERAVDRAGDNVRRVFARANAIEGAHSVRGGPGGRAVSFLGRRTDDPWRRVGLDETATGLVTLDTRRQVTANMVSRLVNEGISDALTGYVDRSGRRWSLDRYASMVARTTTREATSRATVNRLTEHGLDLVTISSHAHQADECTPYDGQTFSLDGTTPGYDELDQLPPFHPNCVHVVTPAAANLDDYIDELETASRETAPAPARTPPARRQAVTPGAAGARARAADVGEDVAPPPFGARARAQHDAGTAARLEAQERRALIDGDPGPDRDAELARDREHDRIARLDKRAENSYLRENLGPDLVTFIDRKWAQAAGPSGNSLRQAYMAGEVTTEEVEASAFDEYQRLSYRKAERERRKQEAGFRTGSIPCFICGKRKSRPSSVCGYCGDDPLTHGGSALEFDRAYGYSGAGGERTGGFDDFTNRTEGGFER